MKKIEDIKFNLDEDMLNNLIKFEEEKKALNKLYNLDQDDNTLLQILEKEQKLNNYRQKFIESFRKVNKEEIEEYMKLKDKI